MIVRRGRCFYNQTENIPFTVKNVNIYMTQKQINIIIAKAVVHTVLINDYAVTNRAWFVFKNPLPLIQKRPAGVQETIKTLEKSLKVPRRNIG